MTLVDLIHHLWSYGIRFSWEWKYLCSWNFYEKYFEKLLIWTRLLQFFPKYLIIAWWFNCFFFLHFRGSEGETSNCQSTFATINKLRKEIKDLTVKEKLLDDDLRVSKNFFQFFIFIQLFKKVSWFS